MNDIKINETFISDFGVTLLDGSYAELLAPPPVKEYVSNNDVTKNGIEVLTIKADGQPATLIDKREVTLTFLIKGSNRVDFLAKLASFKALLMSGNISLHIPDLESKYHLIYQNCTQFDNFNLNACKLSVKFQEPDPTNRA